MLHETFIAKNQALRSSPTIKPFQLHGTGQVAFLPVQLSNGKKTFETYAYLYNGSCRSLLLQSAAPILAIDVNTSGKMKRKRLFQQTKEIDCSPVSLKIKIYQPNKTPILVIEVLAVPDLNMNPFKTNELNKLCKKFEHLNHNSFPNVDDNKVCIIIGIDNLELIHYSNVIKSPKNTTWAVETPLGWTCGAKISVTADEQNPVFKTQINSHPHLDNELFTKVQQWIKIENYGIASSKRAMSKNDEKALQIF